jgi:hypothetical protein
MDAGYNCFEFDSSSSVGLGIKGYFSMLYILLMGFEKI